MPTRFVVAVLAAIALTLVGPASARAAWPHDPNINVPVIARAAAQTGAVAVPDGAGGAIVFWQDARNGAYDVYAQRIDAGGSTRWAASGVPVCTATGDQTQLVACSDSAGGAIVAWVDARVGANTDIYAQRVNANGVVQWTANGVAVCAFAQIQRHPCIAADGFGGAVIAWEDFGSGTNYDIFAQRVTAAGTILGAPNGSVVCLAANDQAAPTIAPDGAGGAYVAWTDARPGSFLTSDVYAQHLNGAMSYQWTNGGIGVSQLTGPQGEPKAISDGAGGVILAWDDLSAGDSRILAGRYGADGVGLYENRLVCTNPGPQGFPQLVSDGSQGAIFFWDDYRSGNDDVYAQRLNATGTALWTATGVAVTTAAATQGLIAIASDGAGGAIVAWEDYRGLGHPDVYAQRVGSNGVVQWTANGVAVSTAANPQTGVGLVADGRGGAVAVWADQRVIANGSDVYAQRVDRFGQLGDPAAAITSVRDVPGDQGGRVKVSWSASWLDADPTYGVVEYRLWRSAPQALAKGGAAVRGTTTDPDEAAAKGLRLVLPFASNDYAWELVGTQTAAILPAYSMIASTTSDSGAAGNWRTAFMVEARSSTAVGADRWYSAPDSGYSVDNLAPATPAPFTGQYLGAQTTLDWNANGEADLAGYRLYRGGSVSFVPSEANRIAFTADTDWLDPAGAPWIYKLTAVDVHGNESAPATLVPAGTTGASDATFALDFAAPSPNPVRDAARLAFTLPVAGAVRVDVLDVTGRRVATPVDGGYAAGAHVLRWDARDDAGHALAPGVYLVRLSAAGRALTRRVAVAR